MSVYYFPTDREEEEDLPKFKEKCLAHCLKCIDICCVWDCCTCWIYFQEFCSIVVFDPFMELFITLCIVVNTLFMAMDHHDMEENFELFLKNGNYVSGCCATTTKKSFWFKVGLSRNFEFHMHIIGLFSALISNSNISFFFKAEFLKFSVFLSTEENYIFL